MRRIADASSKNLHSFVLDVVEQGSIVHNDGWQGYAGLGVEGYTHEVYHNEGERCICLRAFATRL